MCVLVASLRYSTWPCMEETHHEFQEVRLNVTALPPQSGFSSHFSLIASWADLTIPRTFTFLQCSQFQFSSWLSGFHIYLCAEVRIPPWHFHAIILASIDPIFIRRQGQSTTCSLSDLIYQLPLTIFVATNENFVECKSVHRSLSWHKDMSRSL